MVYPHIARTIHGLNTCSLAANPSLVGIFIKVRDELARFKVRRQH